MTDKKRRKRNNQMALVREIILCIITLLATTFALFFLFKYHALELEKNDIEDKLAVYENTDDPYIKVSEANKLIENAKVEAAEEASDKALDELLNKIRIDLETKNSSISTIRSLYPNQVVMVDDNQYYFLDINNNLKLNQYDSSLWSLNESKIMSYNDSSKNYSIGIDVSKFQEKINWNLVAKSDIDYAIIRLGIRGYTEGELFEDDYFEDNIKGALKNNLSVGVYFFTQATTEKEAIEEAEFVLDKLEPYNITYPVVLDVESIGGSNGRGNALSADDRTKYAKIFCDKIKNAGYTPMIYGNIKTFMLMLNIDELEDYEKWFAGYSETPYFPYEFSIWQYTDSGDVSGISEPVDLNISFYKP